MEDSVLSIQKIKRMKLIALLQFNFVMLLLFLFCLYYVRNGWPFSMLLVIFCIAIWGFVLSLIYTWITEKPLGTKAARIVYVFDKEHTVHKSWRHKKMTEIIMLGIVGAGFTVFLITSDLDNAPMEFYALWPFIGGWIGANIGTIIRIVTLE